MHLACCLKKQRLKYTGAYAIFPLLLHACAICCLLLRQGHKRSFLGRGTEENVLAKRDEVQEAGRNYTMMSFIICILNQIKGTMGMWHAWKRNQVNTKYQQGILKVRYH